jgi:DNA-directed RNA polymerase alpha subunit
MSRKQVFSVTLTFSEKMTSDEDIMTIANNIAYAIECEVNRGLGIVPDGADGYTERIMVKPIGMDDVITIDIV